MDHFLKAFAWKVSKGAGYKPQDDEQALYLAERLYGGRKRLKKAAEKHFAICSHKAA